MDFELLARYLSREASREETGRFERWLDEKSWNREVFNQYRNVWEEMAKIGPVAGLDLDSEWRKLENRMKESDAAPVIRFRERASRTVLLTRVAVAAVVVLAVSVGSLFIVRNTGYKAYLTENNTKEIILPDGSDVTLNTHSRIRYKKRFSREVREVALEGEAFFEVEESTDRPFVIGVDGIQVRVLGTSFNVNAYDDNADIEVTVSSGQVALTKPGEVPESLILKPGNRGVFSRSDQTLTLTRDIDRNYLAWKTRSFVFEDQSLADVVRILNRVYGSQIVVASDSLKKERITSKFNNQTLDAILNVLSATLDFGVEKEQDRILLREGS